MRTIRWGMIGCGDVAEIKSGPGFYKAANSTLVGPTLPWRIDPPHVHQPMIQSIVDEMNGEGHASSTGETAARTAWVMDRILAAFRAKATRAPTSPARP